MKSQPILTVMLTYNDLTVENAYEIFGQCRNSAAVYWGIKEKGLDVNQMKRLYTYMKEYGRKTVLEVVAYDEEKSVDGARMAVSCGCDLLIGTTYFDSVNKICRTCGIKYMPYVGKISQRPSVLDGNIDEMIDEARTYIKKGVFGIDLLGYRYKGDKSTLIERFVNEVKVPVCIAGSVDSYEKLDEIKKISPWSFTIGSAFFDNKFGNDFCRQINTVCDYIADNNLAVTGAV